MNLPIRLPDSITDCSDRAFRHLDLDAPTLVAMLVLPLLCNLLLWIGYAWLVEAWQQGFLLLGQWLGLEARAALQEFVYLDGALRLAAPTLVGLAEEPQAQHFLLNVGLAGVALLGSCLLRGAWLPLGYLLRLVAILWAASLAFFHWLPGRFPHDSAGHIAGSLLLVQLLLGVLPWGLALVYYVFDFPFWQKAATSILLLLWLALFAPVQYVLHALALQHGSLIVMPVLYVFAGLSLEILLAVAFYGWAMGLPRNVARYPQPHAQPV